MKAPNFSYEKRLWKRGFRAVAGVDEVGRGCFAGPVVAAAVVFDKKILKNSTFDTFGTSDASDTFPIIDDSKKLSPRQREVAAKWIKKNAYTYGIGSASAKLINRLGMAKATRVAFRRAVSSAFTRNTAKSRRIEFLLIDAFFIPYVKGLPRGTKKIKGDGKLKSRLARQIAIVNGDEKSLSIAAASIVAKVYRDKLMCSLGQKPRYKKYKWLENKGYGTREHREAIKRFGLTGYHRKSFVT